MLKDMGYGNLSFNQCNYSLTTDIAIIIVMVIVTVAIVHLNDK